MTYTCMGCNKKFKSLEDFNNHKCLTISRADQLSPERGRTHGDFRENAKFANRARDLLRSMQPGWDNCSPEQRLALDEIMLKIGRILSGSAAEKEHWDDIEGYAKLGGKYVGKL